MSGDCDNSILGEKDRWVLFDRSTPDGYPLVVLARAGNELVDNQINSGMITIVCCEADPGLVNDMGMPQHTDRIYPIEEGIASELEAFTVGAFHIANITGDGVRKLVYAHQTPLNFEPILGLFSPEGYRLSASQVDDRAGIADLIVPSSVDLQLNGDLGVISNLEKEGDSGEAARRTDFWFYGERGCLAALVAELAASGYHLDRWLEDPLGIVLFREMSVDFATFREATPILVEAAERLGATYDGWETFVVRNEPQVAPEIEQPPKISLLRKLFGPKNR